MAHEQWTRFWAHAVVFFAPFSSAFIFSDPLIVNNQVAQWTRGILYLSWLLCCFFVVQSHYLWGPYVRRFWIRRSLWEKIYFCFLGMSSLASVLFSPEPWRAFVGILSIVFALCTIIVLRLLPENYKKKIMITAYCGASFSLLLALFQIITGMSPASTLLGLARQQSEPGFHVIASGYDYILRASGTFEHPTIAAMVFIWWLGWWASTYSHISRAYRWWGGVLWGFIIAGTFARSSIITLVFACLFLWITSWKIKINTHLTPLRLISCGVITGMFFHGILFFPYWTQRIQGGHTLEKISVAERVNDISTFPKAIIDAGILGTGGGQSAVLHAYQGDIRQPLHNSFLLMVVEWGIAGILFLLLCVRFFFRFFSLKNYWHVIMAFSIFIYGMTDHALITSWPLIISLSVVVGMWAKKHD